MPTVPMSPSRRIYSWSLVYLICAMISDLLSNLAEVAMRHERHLNGLCGDRRTANVDRKLRAGLAERLGDIGHCNGGRSRGRERAAGHLSDAASRLVQHIHPGPGRCPAIQSETGSQPVRSLLEFFLDSRRTGEATLQASSFADGKGKGRLHG